MDIAAGEVSSYGSQPGKEIIFINMGLFLRPHDIYLFIYYLPSSLKVQVPLAYS